MDCAIKLLYFNNKFKFLAKFNFYLIFFNNLKLKLSFLSKISIFLVFINYLFKN